MNNLYRKKRIYLNEGRTKYCVVKVYKDKLKMQEAYAKYSPAAEEPFGVAGVHCGYDMLKVSKDGKAVCGPETGTVFLCYEKCGAGIVSHELGHAVLWAHKHRKGKRQYPIVIKNMDDEEEVLYHLYLAVRQFYDWLYEIEKWFKAQPIEVTLFDGVFGHAKPWQSNVGTSYVHQFHTNEPLPEYLRDRIEKLIQEAVNK